MPQLTPQTHLVAESRRYIHDSPPRSSRHLMTICRYRKRGKLPTTTPTHQTHIGARSSEILKKTPLMPPPIQLKSPANPMRPISWTNQTQSSWVKNARKQCCSPETVSYTFSVPPAGS